MAHNTLFSNRPTSCLHEEDSNKNERWRTLRRNRIIVIAFLWALFTAAFCIFVALWYNSCFTARHIHRMLSATSALAIDVSLAQMRDSSTFQLVEATTAHINETMLNLEDPFYYIAYGLSKTYRLPELRKDEHKDDQHGRKTSRRPRQHGGSHCMPLFDLATRHIPCSSADRMDLLVPRFCRSDGEVLWPENVLCRRSVLHMLLIDVFDEVKKAGGKPVVLYGTLLGAIRGKSILTHTRDVDIGYQAPQLADPRNVEVMMATVRESLRRKGYHMFHNGVWRVCMAPSHPLAGNIADCPKPLEGQPGTRNFRNLKRSSIHPFADLYEISHDDRSEGWKLQLGPPVPDHEFQPYTQVEIHGRPFDTVAEPLVHLRKLYGNNFLTPNRRWRWSVTNKELNWTEYNSWRGLEKGNHKN